ncbi:tetratricopeptide repeat protein [Paraliomyxa miuraensis]|uniref:tetratricopeptide repeat protein n=1 Tax=Paraliomyxa miuraensis TaxID=376150 RepID=UPI00224DF613|nr:hypothetical protein [Paraliomyxa miuraensis]MCX4245111.1 hypothetical protein [Paraliomyxa miuraensis]
MIPSSLPLASLAALALAAPTSDADAGVEAFAEGRYEDAAEILERAYAADPQPDLLFAWAQAERYAGHCDVAVSLYRDYLAKAPPADVEAMAREAIEACGEEPEASATDPEPDAARPSDEPTPPTRPEHPEDRPPSRAARDPWGHALTWSGVAVAGVGAGLLGEAHRRRLAGDRAADEQGYRNALEGAPVLSRAGIAVLAVGGGLLAAGVIRFSVVAARGRTDHARLRPSGAGLCWAFELAPRRSRALR